MNLKMKQEMSFRVRAKLIDFYKLEKNYKLLKEGKVGGNLIYK